MKKLFSILALGALGLASAAALKSAPEQAKAVEGTVVDITANAALDHVRFPDNPDDGSLFGNEKLSFGTNWEQASMPELSSSESSFARLVLEAPEAGTYSVYFHVVGWSAYPMKLYVNSAENVISKNAFESTGGEGEVGFEVILNAGKNVLVLQINNWGKVSKFSFDPSLTLHNGHSEVAGEYKAADFIFQATHLATNFDLFNPEAEIAYDSLHIDGNVSFESAATLFIDPIDTNSALDVKIKSKGASTLKLALNGDFSNSATFTLPTYSMFRSYTYHISKASLEALGYDVEEENVMRFSATQGSIQILGAKESSVEGEVDPIEDDVPVDPNELDVDAIVSKVKINGRSPVVSDGICLDWSLSGIDFVFNGGGAIYANFDVTSNSQNTRFAVEIDGNPIGYVTPSDNTMITPANLANGTHRVTLYKTSEAAGNLCKLVSMTLPEGTSIEKPEAKPLKFEILGDSITCANQIAAGVEDAYWGYARQLASAYNADANLISVSGRGLRQGFNSEEGWPASIQNQIKDLWHKTDFFRDPSASWSTSNYEPDVVVASLGSNDLGDYILTCEGCSKEAFLADVTSFSQTLRSSYPNAKIVWAYGSFVNRKYIDEYKATVEALNDENITFVEFPQLMHGDTGHANDLNHDLMASILSEKISEMLGVDDPYVRRFDYETIEAEDSMAKGGTRKTPGDAGDIYWSNSAYVGDMGFDSESSAYPHSIDEINSDLSNVSYLKVNFTAPKSAMYTIRVGYATIGSANVGYRVDNGAWHSLTLSGSDWAGGHGLFAPVEVKLSQGEHNIYFTSCLNEGGWVNYDFFDIIRGVDVASHSVSTSNVEHVTFDGLPSYVCDGDSLEFTASLDDEYSKSEIVVKANDVEVTPTNGVYVVSDVTEDVVITVEGVALNTWTVYYKDVEGGTVVTTQTYAVGETITAPSDVPTREGYVFDGWDMTFTTMTNSDIEIYAKWKEPGSTTPETTPTENSGKKKGCKSSIAAASIVVSGFAFAGAGLLIAKNKKKEK